MFLHDDPIDQDPAFKLLIHLILKLNGAKQVCMQVANPAYKYLLKVNNSNIRKGVKMFKFNNKDIRTKS